MFMFSFFGGIPLEKDQLFRASLGSDKLLPFGHTPNLKTEAKMVPG